MLYFLVAFVFSLLLSAGIRQGALRLNVVDRPDRVRKFHPQPVPLLGGVAIWLAFWGVLFYVLWFQPEQGIELLGDKLKAAFIASTILLVIGVVDEVRPYSARSRLLLSSLAVLVGVMLGLYPEKLTNPFGDWFTLLPVVGGLISFFWLLGMTYTTKILDGLDGLATGIVAIGALMIYLLTASPKFYQPNVGLVAIIFLGACLGFLVFNFYPAKIYLGESGGLFLGFTLGVLAVLGGGKFATALLVMAVPIFDLGRVICRRFKRGQSVFQADREHLFFQLLDRGWTKRQVVVALYLAAASFGALTLGLQSYQKLLALGLLALGMVAVAMWLQRTRTS